MKKEIAMFGAGCFWGVQATFDKLPGILKTEVGYSGGRPEYKNPSYKEVCTDKTGHAEVIRIEFDPKKISYEKLLEVFWNLHDPTQLNRQGPDIGAQYRSVIFYYTERQKKLAEKSKEEIQKKIAGKIVTEITKARPFYKAEDYHQKYYIEHPCVCHV